MNTLKCLIGVHKYKIVENVETKVNNFIISKLIISECECCGKIKFNKITNYDVEFIFNISKFATNV